MTYELAPGSLLENPLRVKEDQVKDYLFKVMSFHRDRTPYWERAFKDVDLDSLFDSRSLPAVVENLLNAGLSVEENYLRSNWLEFFPRDYRGKVRFYQSSGTTRERAIGHWDRNYVDYLVAYLKAALDELYNFESLYEGERVRAVAHGPYGWYQDEISELVWRYSGYLYFIGMETDGLKKVLAREGVDAVLRILDPLVRYTKRVMEADRINLVRSAPPLMGMFEPYAENIKAVILSGVGIDDSLFQALSEKFPNSTLVPLYGYYLFGDLVGLRRGSKFVYYPNWPFTVIYPVEKSEDGYRVLPPGRRGRLALIVARPEVLMIKVEDETVERVKGEGAFRCDGFADPKRSV